MRRCEYPECERCERPDCDMDENDIRRMLAGEKVKPEYRTHRTKEEAKEAVWNFLLDFALENGYMPTYRQIADGIGYRQQHTIPKYLKELEEEGLIIWKTGKPREYALAGYKYVKAGDEECKG